MTAVNEITGLQNSSSLSTQRTSSAELGQDAFLTLMTTQLKNQDPFEPMDNGQFLSQIAQFGTVNGISDLKDSFSDFSNNMQSNQALQAANIVGHNVLAETDTGQLYQDGYMQGAVELDSYAANVAVNIYSANGALVNRIDLGEQLSGTVPFLWDGTTFNGAHAGAGDYRMEVEVVQGNTTSIAPTLMFGNISSLSLGSIGEEMQVDVQGIGQVPFSQISRIL